MAENRIGPYSIVRLIKGGGQGRVYLGYDNRLRRQVAIKIHALPVARTSRRQVLSEARRASRINCPQVVQIYDLIESAGHLAMVMEYVPGCDLEELLSRQRLSMASVLTIALDLAAALAAARQQKVVHGDLKAANVLISRQGRVKLTDFGVARDSDDAASPEAGSYSALTPEHLRGEPLELRSDLFSLGCLVYRMLSGEHPFYRDGRLQSHEMLSSQIPPLDGGLLGHDFVPEGLATLIEQLLRADPQQRPGNTHPVRRQLRLARQQLPLAQGDQLQSEARPAFRLESPEDLPLDIPADLRDGGRSRIKRSYGGRLLRYFRSLRPSTRVTVTATAVALIGVPIALAMQDYPVRIHFESPTLELAASADIPPQVGERWLMDNVYEAAESAIGPLHASGAVRPRAYYAELADREPQLTLATSLRCDIALCLFSVSRGEADSFKYRQVAISPQLPESVWRELIGDATHSLLD